MKFRIKHVPHVGFFGLVRFNKEFGWKVIGPKNEFGYHSLYHRKHREAPLPNKKAAKLRCMEYDVTMLSSRV